MAKMLLRRLSKQICVTRRISLHRHASGIDMFLLSFSCFGNALVVALYHLELRDDARDPERYNEFPRDVLSRLAHDLDGTVSIALSLLSLVFVSRVDVSEHMLFAEFLADVHFGWVFADMLAACVHLQCVIPQCVKSTEVLEPTFIT